MSFIFDSGDKNGRALKYKNYWYYFMLYDYLGNDNFRPIITFKTKYELKYITPRLFALKSKKYSYIIDIKGNILFKDTERKIKKITDSIEKNSPFTKYRYNVKENKPDFDTEKYKINYDFTWQNKKYYSVSYDKKNAIFDKAGNTVIDFKYYPRYIREIKDNVYFIIHDYATDLYGIIDINKNVIISPKYKYLFVFPFDNRVYFSAKNSETNLEGVIDIDENVIIPFMYDYIHIWNIDYEKETIQVAKDNKCGIIDINNNVLLDFKYNYICGFHDNEYSFAIDENDKWGVIDRKGKEINFDIENVKELELKYRTRKAKQGRKEHYEFLNI